MIVSSSHNLPFAPNEKFIKRINNRLLLSSAIGFKVPLAFLAGLRVEDFTAQQCSVSLPYRWMTQNPFRSIYFAAQTMAAEMSTALPIMLAIQSSQSDIAMLVTQLNGSFSKKANARTTFRCVQGEELFHTIHEVIQTKEPKTFVATTVGTMPNGVETSRFDITWSFRLREKR